MATQQQIKQLVREILDESPMLTLQHAVCSVTLEFDDLIERGDCLREIYKVEIAPALGDRKRQVYRIEWDFYCDRNVYCYWEGGEGWVVRRDKRSNWFPPWLSTEIIHSFNRKLDRVSM